MSVFCRCAHARSVHYDGKLCGLCACKGFSAEPRTPTSFEAYSQAHGRGPAEQLAHDSARFPGGKMAGYLAWMTLRIAEFKALRGIEHIPPEGPVRADFEAWLWSEGLRPSVALDGIAEVSP